MNLFFEHENFFHPCVIPFRGKLILLMSKITAMDRFTPPYFCFSEDGGKSWSKPEQIPTLKAFEKCAKQRYIFEEVFENVTGFVIARWYTEYIIA